MRVREGGREEGREGGREGEDGREGGLVSFPDPTHKRVWSRSSVFLGFRVIKSDYEVRFEEHVCDRHVGTMCIEVVYSNGVWSGACTHHSLASRLWQVSRTDQP